ncbi:hypothetical protein [Flavobacterium caseinilyticum]|uniref:Lipocalin-like domain-containing protein n=1 Tax=Flavobacterium caseinilyticum TaxID=2541732 RepID=A0A4R5B398_9FLAO|nr:hypothetical protein [Flavobacterium caseinilyticum]TDD77572.1 hypothetical protein E0F89_08310 [Flavobacterium caseinilyticum]
MESWFCIWDDLANPKDKTEFNPKLALLSVTFPVVALGNLRIPESNTFNTKFMKTLIIALLLTISTCLGQSSIEKNSQNKLIHKWELKQFEYAEKNGVIVTVTLTKYADVVSFEFKDNQTLEVIYSNAKKENYLWKYKRNLIEITSVDTQNFNAEIIGAFEIYFQDKMSQLFLQRKNDPHHGIILKL